MRRANRTRCANGDKPSSRTSPSHANMPMRMRVKVDFPDPLGPMSAVFRPEGTDKEMPSRAFILPKIFTTFRSAMSTIDLSQRPFPFIRGRGSTKIGSG